MCDNACPWAENTEMRDSLESAGWRFFILVGLVKPFGEFIEFFEMDKKKYPDLVCAEGMTPQWDFIPLMDFMHSLTGYDKSICEQWMDFDFNWG
jgi:hypothetical protein